MYATRRLPNPGTAYALIYSEKLEITRRDGGGLWSQGIGKKSALRTEYRPRYSRGRFGGFAEEETPERGEVSQQYIAVSISIKRQCRSTSIGGSGIPLSGTNRGHRIFVKGEKDKTIWGKDSGQVIEKVSEG